MTVTEVTPRPTEKGQVAAALIQQPPPLENGDRLTRAEFERRYHAMPSAKKAELIEGMVHMPSPLHFEGHAEPHTMIITWLGVYRAATPGVRVGDNASVRLDADNEVQPDVLLRLDTDTGGHSRITPDDYLEGAPELVVEIAATSASVDLGDKLKVYRRNGVQEYVVWQVYDDRLNWFELKEGDYTQLTPDESGVIHSRVFPGLWLAVKALLDGDVKAVLAELQRGLETDEHRSFVERLAATLSKPIEI